MEFFKKSKESKASLPDKASDPNQEQPLPQSSSLEAEPQVQEPLWETGDEALSQSTIELAEKEDQKDTELTGKFNRVLRLLIGLSLLVGVVVGMVLRRYVEHDNRTVIYYFEFPGRLLLNMLSLLVIPLVVSSLVSATVALSSKTSGKICIGSFLYTIITSTSAVGVAIVMSYIIEPGILEHKLKITTWNSTRPSQFLLYEMDVVSWCFPPNLITAAFQTTNTIMETTKNEDGNFTTFPRTTDDKSPNILGISVISIFVGIAIKRLGTKGEPIKVFFHLMNDVTMVLIDIFIWYSPCGMIFLISSKILASENPMTFLEIMGKYVQTVLGGLMFHGLVMLPGAYLVITGKNPIYRVRGVMEALAIAWATSSSFASLPIAMRCLIHEKAVDERVLQTVAPIVASINKDGTALYQVVTCFFIAEIYEMHLTAVNTILLCLTSVMTSMSTPGFPRGAMVTTAIVLTVVGLPIDSLSLVLTVDWFLDKFRTVINVWSDVISVGILSDVFETRLEQVIPPSENVGSVVSKSTSTEISGKTEGSLVAGSIKSEISVKSQQTVKDDDLQTDESSVQLFSGNPFVETLRRMSYSPKKSGIPPTAE